MKTNKLNTIIESFNEKQEKVVDFIEATQKVDTLTHMISMVEITLSQLKDELKEAEDTCNDIYREIEDKEPLNKEKGGE